MYYLFRKLLQNIRALFSFLWLHNVIYQNNREQVISVPSSVSCLVATLQIKPFLSPPWLTISHSSYTLYCNTLQRFKLHKFSAFNCSPPLSLRSWPYKTCVNLSNENEKQRLNYAQKHPSLWWLRTKEVKSCGSDLTSSSKWVFFPRRWFSLSCKSTLWAGLTSLPDMARHIWILGRIQCWSTGSPSFTRERRGT